MNRSQFAMELGSTVLDVLESGNLLEHLRAFLGVVKGTTTRDDFAPFPTELSPLEATALRLLGGQASISSGDLARIADVSTETARLCLRRLEQDGTLTRTGAKRGTRYARAPLPPAV